jgi:aminocarboxymuconate-semialdehyde decarboxylase
MPRVDAHTHFLPYTWPDLAARFGTPDWPWMRHDGPDQAMVMVGDAEFRPVTRCSWDAQARLADMDRDGIDAQVVSATPVLFGYGRPARQAAEAARIFNDLLLASTAEAEGRLVPFCQVPLQDPDAACAELDRCLDAGHAGVQIGNHVGDDDLDHEGVVTFLQHCAARGVPVFVHPWDMPDSPRLRRWMLKWTVGMPMETQLSIATLILSGVFDRIPPTLRICFAHGGGSFAFLLGRLDNAWHRRDIARGASQRPPAAYVDRFLVDSAVFSEPGLRLLVDVMGSDRVVLGSDYPFPLGEERAGELVRTVSWLDSTDRDRVLGGNALEFLGLKELPSPVW